MFQNFRDSSICVRPYVFMYVRMDFLKRVGVYMYIYICLKQRKIETGELKEDHRHVVGSRCTSLFKYLNTETDIKYIHSLICVVRMYLRVNPMSISISISIQIYIYICINIFILVVNYDPSYRTSAPWG